MFREIQNMKLNACPKCNSAKFNLAMEDVEWKEGEDTEFISGSIYEEALENSNRIILGCPSCQAKIKVEFCVRPTIVVTHVSDAEIKEEKKRVVKRMKIKVQWGEYKENE